MGGIWHPFNHPRYHALLLRSLRYARAHKRVVLWYRAIDNPYKGLDETGDTLQRRKEIWLTYPDNKTCGIAGLLPLVRGMPMRCTDNIDRAQRFQGLQKGKLN